MLRAIFIDTAVVFLITYAIIDIISRIVCFISPKNVIPCGKQYVTLLLDSNTENLEHVVIRAAKYADDMNCGLILIHRGLTDEHTSILNQLMKELPYVRILDAKERSLTEIFEDVS